MEPRSAFWPANAC